MTTQAMIGKPSAADGALVGKATLRAARTLGFNNVALAQILGVSEAQVTRLDRGEAALTGKAFEIGLLVIRVFRSLSGIVGADDTAARSWIAAPNLALGGGRPCELMRSLTGLVSVVHYLDSARAKL